MGKIICVSDKSMKKAIYKVTNKVNQKIYIGQSVDPWRRFQVHCARKEKYTSLLNRAINHYGVENFQLEILGWFEDYNEKEKEYIAYYKCLSPHGYNIAPGGEEPPHGHGENNSFHKISAATANGIQQDLLNWSISRKSIVNKYKVTYNIVRHINDGDSWRREDLTYPLRPAEKVLNERRADKVIELLQTTTLSQTEIGRQVGWNRSAVTMINIGKNHHRDGLDYPIRK